MEKIINFSKPTLGKEEEEAVLRVMRSGWLAAGLETEAFEKEFCQYIGAKYCIFTNSCTSALKMAYKWLHEEFEPEDKNFRKNWWWDENYRTHIFIPKNTFCATYSAAKEMGFDFVQDDKTYVDYAVAVWYGGVKKTELPTYVKLRPKIIIEDSAHRIEPNDPLVGKIRCYSFYVTKNMTTGSGGMFVTNEKEIYEKARLYWKDGLSTSTFERQRKGYDYKVLAMAGGYDGNDISAAIGRVQLKKLPEFTRRRNEIVSKYNMAFGKEWSGNHLYPISRNKKLIDYLEEHGIRAGFFYPPDGYVCLPIYPLLKNEEQEYIIQKVKEFNGKL